MSLVGRAEEQLRIEMLVRSASGGIGSSLVVAGEVGSGKSVLLEHARAVASETGMQLLSCAGRQNEESLAFAALADLLRPLLPRIDSLPEVQARALRGALALGPAVSSDPFTVYAAALGLLLQRAEESPVLAVVDDLHFVDAPTRDALKFLVRRLNGEAVGVVLGLRADAIDRRHVERAWQDLPISWLQGLDVAAAEELLEHSMARKLPVSLVNQCVLRTLGNPLALLEIAEELRVVALDGTPEARLELSAPSVASDLFARRLDRLDGEGADALLLACLHGPSTNCSTLFTAAQSWGVTPEAFDRVEAAGLMRIEGNTLSIRHPLLETAVLARIESSRRRAAHRVLADSMTAPGDVARRAWHLAEAALGPDEATAEALECSGREAAARSGFAAAAPIFERAAALSPSYVDRARRLQMAGESARRAGDTHAARRLLSGCLGAAPTMEVQADAHRSVGRLELQTSNFVGARERLTSAAQLLLDIDKVRAAELLSEAAIAALLGADTGGAADLLTTAQGLTEEPVPSVEATVGLVTGMLAISDVPAVDDRLVALSQSARRAAHSPEALSTELVLCLIRWAWFLDLELGRALTRSMVEELRACAGLGLLPFALYTQSYLDIRAGRLASAAAAGAEATRLAEDTGNDFALFLSLGSEALAAAWSGDEATCRDRARQGAALRRRLDNVLAVGEEFDALGHLELSLGNYETAVGHLDVPNRLPGTSTPDLTRWSCGELAEALLVLGRPLPEDMAERLKSYSESDTPAGVAISSRLQGLVATRDDFPKWFDRSAASYAQAAMPLEQARSLLCYGQRLRRAGDKLTARSMLRAAHSTFDAAGARIWADRAAQELTATGQHLRREPASREALTPQEHQVATLVASGASNREAALALFISPKTVEAHLGRAYRKLGVRTRTQLAHQFSAQAAGSFSITPTSTGASPNGN